MPLSLERGSVLVERAARDDPPTVIDDAVYARLERAGVDALELALGPPIEGKIEVAENAEEAERAIGIWVGGPGLTFVMPFGGEATPIAVALARILAFVEGFDQLRRFRLAARDMRFVEDTALALLDRDGLARMFERMLETALVVTYARPYLPSSGSGVPGRWHPKGDDRAFHEHMIDVLRHPYHAHSDRTPHRTLIDTTGFLGLEGPPTFAEAWKRLSDVELETLAGLARRQAERLEAEANRIGAELGEERGY